MSGTFLIDYWYLWAAGMIVCPLLAVLPQLDLIRQAIALGEEKPEEAGLLFMKPGPIVMMTVFGMGTVIFGMLFFGSVVVGVITAVHAVIG